MNELKVFENKEFGNIRVVEIDGEGWLIGKDIAHALGYSNASKAIINHVDEEDKRFEMIETESQNGNVSKTKTALINESGLYSLVLKSKLQQAKKFKRWVTSEVLPQIRQTGGYIPMKIEDTPEELMARALIIANKTLELREQRIKELEIDNKKLTTEVIHKENVIVGLVEDIDLETKRQRINQIIRYGANGRYSERWSLLYKEFEGKFHINLKRRMESDEVKNIKPKIKSKMDYIDRVLNMTPQLYEVTCKVFENDVEKLKSEWESTIKREFE